jgi:DNA-binding NarL/FixJ family response regulator
MHDTPDLRPTSHRVVLVDDHRILREGLRAILTLEPDLDVVGEAGSLADALDVIGRSAPDLVVTDLSLPDAGGTGRLVQALRACRPAARILVLSVHAGATHVRTALGAGANGYVVKDASRLELVAAVRGVLAGEQPVRTAAGPPLAATFIGHEESPPAPAATFPESVTDRERQVLTMIATGSSTKGIASILALSVKTVEKHRANMMRKLGLRNVAAVTRFAIDAGLVHSGAGPAPAGATGGSTTRR